MSKIKVAELFYSLQGEGQYIGTPSIFLRTFGCNFKCAGFGLPRGQLSEEWLQIDPSKYEKYEDLPLVHTGCDSYASWDPRFKHLSPMLSVDEIAEKMAKLLPGGKFGNDKHLIITGGEPLLGWQRSYPDLFRAIFDRGMNLSDLTFETNGSQPLTEDFERVLWEMRDYVRVTFSVSSKLPTSGESWEEAIRPDIIQTYLRNSDLLYFKWVVSTPDDVADVERAIEAYRSVLGSHHIPIYIMPAGGTSKVYDGNERWVADVCAEKGWRYTPRLQVQLWKNAWGT